MKKSIALLALLFVVFCPLSVVTTGYATEPTDMKQLIRLSENGDPKAQTELATQYMRGDNPDHNISKALYWFNKAADSGYASAQYALGVIYYNGMGLPKDEELAFKWFLKAGEVGEIRSQHNLGYMYSVGSGVEKSDVSAYYWWLKAANQGHKESEYNLGLIYLSGKGVKQNDQEALKWLKRCADQDFAPCQNTIGVLYQTGRAVAQDYKQAYDWYKKAAIQEYAQAQYNLGSLYYKGWGVNKDEEEGIRWIKLASVNNFQTATDIIKQLEKEGKIINSSKEISMSADVIFNSNYKSILVVTAINTKNKKDISLGSGVVVDKEKVVTNCHVLTSSYNPIVLIKYQDEILEAIPLYGDLDQDLCLLYVQGLNAPSVEFGSTSELKVGQSVFAIGSPEGLELTYSNGILSGLREHNKSTYIQITAPISMGSSGGGLFDGRGKLIGITTFMLKEGQNLNFAIPVEWVINLSSNPNKKTYREIMEIVALKEQKKRPTKKVSTPKSTNKNR